MSLYNKYLQKNIIYDASVGIPCLRFSSLLIHTGLEHGVFTRKGGMSLPPYDSLNVSYNTGDRHEHVTGNLGFIKDRVGAGNIMYMHQVHGTEIITLHRDDHNNLATREADAIITDVPSLGIMVKQADCQGVIIHDGIRSVVAVVHCGWRGNVQDILGLVVDRMRSEFGCNAKNLSAAIGPSLGPCCAEFTAYRDMFPEEFNRYIVSENHFDLWEISRMQLSRAGVSEDNIEIAGICTKCNTDMFYSYRAEGDTGRFGTVAMIR